MLLKHMLYQYVILKHALEDKGELHGKSTTWGTLAQVLIQYGLDASGREVMDALLLLNQQGLLRLKKIIPVPNELRYLIYDYVEFPKQDQFFWGQFNLHVTPEGSAYFDGLEAKVRSIPPPTPQNPPIGFHP